MLYLYYLIFIAILFLSSNALANKDIVSNIECIHNNINNSIKDKIFITGGVYSKPYKILIPYKEYVLENDLYADGSAIIINTSNIIINLNGKKIIYNNKIKGEGISTGTWNNKNIVIMNGSIEQGSALSEGDQYGVGNNPIRMTPFGVDKLIISDLNVVYAGKDVGGIIVSAKNSFFVNNTIVDKWLNGNFKNRHQGVSALSGAMHSADFVNNTYANNKILNCRQKGISSGNGSSVFGNTVVINSLATNSTGIAPGTGSKIYNNNILGRGEHPIGIFYVSKEGEVEIYNNTIDVQTTRLGTEYGGNPTCLNPKTPCGNYAVGFRTTWGGDNINFHDNTIVVRTDSAYNGTHSVTGKPVVIHAKGRGLMVAVNAGEKAKFYNNTITVLDKDGSGKAFGIACTGNNAGEMEFEGNRVTSNILNVALGDEYGACGGYPLFIHNTFVKSDNYPAYRTIASELGGYFEGTGRFVDNQYRSGAAQERVGLNAGGKAGKSVLFGSEFVAELVWSDGRPIADAMMSVDNGGPLTDLPVKADEQGKARLVLYEYELHNRDSNVEQKRQIASQVVQVVVGEKKLIGRLALQTGPKWMGNMSGVIEVPLYAGPAGEERAGTLKILRTLEKVQL